MAILYGKVVERFTRRPVSGATVRIGNTATYTDSQGGFALEAPMGYYQLTIQHQNYRGATQNLSLSVPQSNIGEIQIDSIIRAL
jgi:hypothetical protein